MRTIGYVVVSYSAVGYPELDDRFVYDSKQQARAARKEEESTSAELGDRRRHAVAELIEVD